MFVRELQAGMLVCPFDTQVGTGSYWLTRLKSRHMAPAMALFRNWILAEAGGMPLADQGVSAALRPSP
jgi:LysR family transcriptional regulator of beta-lactamase